MKTCKICGRKVNKLECGMCRKHYRQFKKFGYCLDNNPRTIKDPNEIIIYEDYAEIVMYDKNCNENGRAIIDLDDVEKIKDYKWSINHGYVNTFPNIRLHRLITNCSEDKVVDHINHNKLDNRKSNLRICSQHQNMMNKIKQNNNKSGYTGVYWSNEKSRWYAQITVNKNTINLGYFNTKEDAIYSRKQAEIKYFGEYRFLD